MCFFVHQLGLGLAMHWDKLFLCPSDIELLALRRCFYRRATCITRAFGASAAALCPRTLDGPRCLVGARAQIQARISCSVRPCGTVNNQTLRLSRIYSTNANASLSTNSVNMNKPAPEVHGKPESKTSNSIISEWRADAIFECFAKQMPLRVLSPRVCFEPDTLPISLSGCS